jgi:ribonuclease P protein component
MSPAVVRLKRRPEFLRVAATRRRWAAPGLVLQTRRHPKVDGIECKEPYVRVGFTVSRKVGNAVKRNRARRRLREVVDRVFPVHAMPGNDFVVIGRARTLTRSFDSLIGDLTTALKRLDVFVVDSRHG